MCVIHACVTCLRLHAFAHVCVCGCRYHECQPAKASRTAKTATRKCSESRSRETRIGLSLSSTVHLSPSPSLFLVFSLCDIFTYTSSFSILSRSASIFLHPLPDLRSGVRKYYVLTQESSENVTSRYTYRNMHAPHRNLLNFRGGRIQMRASKRMLRLQI